MFGKIGLFFGACILLASVIGCAAVPYAIEGLQAAGQMGAFNSSSSSSILNLGKVIEKHQVGNYEVVVRDGFYKSNPSIVFIAYKDRQDPYLSFDKKNSDDMKMINDFNQMNEAGKKRFIKEQFLKYAKLDLGPVEAVEEKKEEPPEKATVSAPSPSFPTPGFAPRP